MTLPMSVEVVSLKTSVGVKRGIMNKNEKSKICLVDQEKVVVEQEKFLKEMDKDFYRPKWSNEDKSVFAPIDRAQENKDIIHFQETGDKTSFERVYENRIPTLRVWARKYHYLMDSADDMFGEFTFYFSKAAMTYNGERGNFNTWLYSILQNCVRNLRNFKKAKKRKPLGADPNSISNFTLSLDYDYNSKDGNESTLKDLLSEEISEEGDVIDQMNMEETIEILSKKDPFIKDFLRKLGNGNTISSIMRTLKTKSGKINISQDQAKRLSTRRRCNRIVSDIIKDHSDIQKFNLLDYKITPSNKLHYTVEMHKTDESDKVMKTIRILRRDKDRIMSLIQG